MYPGWLIACFKVGVSSTRLQNKLFQTPVAVRILPPEKIDVLDNTLPLLQMVVAGGALPKNHGSAHGTRVGKPRIPITDSQ